ncbi:MAG: hypothetical protein JNM81_00765 [Rhodospirillaceae bacterium]|nr:hypothetical protein [Rhodospirillaceae bacterium]
MRSRRAAVAGVIGALHIAVVYALVSMTVHPVQHNPQTEKPIAWLNVAKPDPPKPITVPQISTMAHRPFELPKAPVIAITAPTATDFAALRSYVWCGALDDGKALVVSPKPCNNMKLELHNAVAGPRQPTEHEKAQMHDFDRQNAMAKAPALLPCFGGVGVSIFCLANGIANGFEFTAGSYADADTAKCDSRFAGAAPCARNYSLQSFAPTNRPPPR